jgi:hypothetical protein
MTDIKKEVLGEHKYYVKVLLFNVGVIAIVEVNFQLANSRR